MFDLQPPRHISTLHSSSNRCNAPIRELSGAQRTCRELVGRVDPTLLTHLGSRVCIAAESVISGGGNLMARSRRSFASATSYHVLFGVRIMSKHVLLRRRSLLPHCRLMPADSRK
jgi:hypothetical protein